MADRLISQFSEVLDHIWLFTNLVKKKGSSCGPCEASGDELRAIGQNCVAVCTGEQASATNMIQKNSSHFWNLCKSILKTWKKKKYYLNKASQQTKTKKTHVYCWIFCKPVQLIIAKVLSDINYWTHRLYSPFLTQQIKKHQT